MELSENPLSSRHTRSSQRIALASVKTGGLEISLLSKNAEENQHYSEPDSEDESDHEGISCDDMMGMFLNVDVEVDANAELLYTNENSSGVDHECAFSSNADCETPSVQKSLLLDDNSQSKGIIAQLAQKLNSKLNAVMVPKPTDSLVACLEPEISVVTEGTNGGSAYHVCPWCPLSFTNSDSFEEHKSLCHSKAADNPNEQGDVFSHPHSCEECGQTFAKSWNLKRHYYMHSGERPFVCVDCGQRFGSGGDLSVHRRSRHSSQSQRQKQIISSQQRWLCYLCQFSFLSKDALITHQRMIHTDFICQHCAKIFETKDLLKEHLRSTHTVCQICSKSFSNLHYLRKGHMLTQHKLQWHEDTGIIVCLRCKQELNDESHLKEHACLISWLRPFKCKWCGETFRGANDLRVHIRIHTGERPFSCPECGESFTQKGNLTVHLRTHTGEKPFECITCGRCFMKSSNLKEHMKVHERGERLDNNSTGHDNNLVEVWADKDPAILKRVSEMAKESHAFRAAIAGKLMKTGFVPQKKDESASFRDTIVERVKQVGVLSFGNGNISLRLL